MITPPTTLSPEGRTRERVERLCSINVFSYYFEGVKGLSKARIYNAFTDSRKPLDSDALHRVTEVLGLMEELQKDVSPVPVNWARVEDVRHALTARMAASIEHESGSTLFDEVAARATEKVIE
jgi:hypothetical protein